MNIDLCPTQQIAYDYFLRMIPTNNILIIRGGTGRGKSTFLHKLNEEIGGKLLTVKDLIDKMHEQHPLAIVEAVEKIMMSALSEAETVLLDDLSMIVKLCNHHMSPRVGFLDVVLISLMNYASQSNKKLIFACDDDPPPEVEARALVLYIHRFNESDYKFLCSQFLGASASENIDYKKIYHYASKLNAHDLRLSCIWLKEFNHLHTEGFLEHLRLHHKVNNVDLQEVQQVNLSDLKGMDDIITSLEANVILPFENEELARSLDLQPKRGVLLAGHPGTGKTSVGRALAHRMKGKFFLIDGNMIAGTSEFYAHIDRVFQAAQNSAPCVIFIDDTDVIFEEKSELGLYRYLLTKLDGLESESQKQVCVMMTAMDVGNMPAALIRSGRIELWLETQLPDTKARSEILTMKVSNLPPELQTIDIAQLSDATDGFTGADLKRLVEDGKTLYAFDKINAVPIKSFTEYLMQAIETVQKNKDKYAEAQARIKAQQIQ